MNNITKEDLIIKMLERLQHLAERNEDELRIFRQEVDARFEKIDQQFEKVDEKLSGFN